MQRAKTIGKNCCTSKECLGWNTYLRPSVTWNTLNCFPGQSNGHHNAQITFSVQSDKKFLEESAKVKETCFLTIWIYQWEKPSPGGNLHQNSLLYTLSNMFHISSDMHHFEASQRRYTLDNAKILLKIHIFEQDFSGKLFWKSTKSSANDWMQLTLFISSPNLHWDAIHGKLG